MKGLTVFRVCIFVLAAFLAMGIPAVSQAKVVKLGTSFSVGESNATYSSDNNHIAHVNASGRVTAKKIGTTNIYIHKNGKSSRKRVQVVANEEKETYVKVCTGEVDVLGSDVFYDEDDQTDAGSAYEAKLRVKNNGTSSASKVIVKGSLGGVELTFHFGKLKAGQMKTATIAGYTAATQTRIRPTKLYVYSQKMCTVYDYATEKTSFRYGGPDTTPPKITGFIGKNSYNRDEKKHIMPYQVIYSGEEEKYNFFQYVKGVDERKGKVKLEVDTSKVNFEQTGNYTITYTATDEAGNSSTAKAKIAVRVPGKVDQYAELVLKTIIKESWSEKHKYQAIYNYTRNHISYVGYSDKSNWEREAINGIKNGAGDCYTYYALARALLTRAGLPNIEVTRVRGKGHHWWSMVYLKGGWYHYDCGSRRAGGKFCLLTDQQLKNYSAAHGNIYIWDYAKKPKTPKKKISNIY